jgi:hypothetical protein
LCSEIHKLIMLIWNKEELPHQWKESIVVPIHRKGYKTDCSNCRGISVLSTSFSILSNILLARLTPCADRIIGVTNVDFDVVDERLIRISVSGRYWRKNRIIMLQCISYLQISRKREVQLGGKCYTVFSLSLEYPGN